MPTNAKKINSVLKSLSDQLSGKTSGKAKFKATPSNKLTPVNLKITPRNYKTAVDSTLNNIQSQIARRLMELLAVDTPKKTGRLNGGWTTKGVPITNRFNNRPSAIPSELSNILTLASDGRLSINIQNAVEYALAVNYGSRTNQARLYVEMALRQIVREASRLGVEITVTRG